MRLPDRFDLVTGSPPYWDVSEGVVPADSQKAHARFELRGDIGDYALAARAALADGGDGPARSRRSSLHGCAAGRGRVA
jgi:tRNA1Val (adenine37-N6)-methyltransferase